MTKLVATIVTLLCLLGWQSPALASEGSALLNLTDHPIGLIGLGVFVLAYALVIAEEFIHMRKSKPVVLAAGVIWLLVAIAYAQQGLEHQVTDAVRHTLLEYAELMLFLIVAMTYINAMEERRVFDALRSWLVSQGYGFRKLFWFTGTLAFFISPFADNLTTALIMCAVVMAVGAQSARFISLSCINIVIAANAGGAFSPFGDITTLMVWQAHKVEFWTFFALFIPSAVNFLVPAIFMHFAVPNEKPLTQANEPRIAMRRGARRILLLFMFTIAITVAGHSFLHLPPVLGMMTGLGLLNMFGYYLRRTPHKDPEVGEVVLPFDIFNKIARIEWDTLLFFYGVIMCVGGLGFMGYLALLSASIYGTLGATTANIAIGVISAIIDNIPVMFAVLNMNPDMSTGQWLLVTLTAGVGGSLLSIGSAAGVALMGQARGAYTFFSHLKWTPVIALGYAASIAAHMAINAQMF